MGLWCEADEDCANDELVCTDSVCTGNECTSSIDEEGMKTSSGCPGEANCSEGFCERGDYGY